MTLSARAPARIYHGLISATQGAESIAYPIVDLAVRLALSQAFFASAVVKLSLWDSAVYLATYEYPIPWLTPHATAIIGVALELGGSILLTVGLFSRAAAFSLWTLSIFIRLHYPLADVSLYWLALFAWFVVFGSGPLSLDRLFSRGFEAIAIPFAPWVTAVCRLFTEWLAAPYLLAVRAWIAVSILAITFPALADLPGAGLWIPRAPAAVVLLGSSIHVVLALALAVGLATRAVALTAILLCAGTGLAVSHLPPIDWTLILALLAVRGPGGLSVDRLLDRYIGSMVRARGFANGALAPPLAHVVIVGGGFGGIAAAKALKDAPCAVLLVDQHNYHLFQPLLYQVATAGLSPADIAAPIRGMFRDQENVRVILGSVEAVDTQGKFVILDDGKLKYDQLVIATGAQHSYFGHEEWAPFAPGLKGIEDATNIRGRILFAFEAAENVDDPAIQQELMTFVIVGAGPTGVELAGAIAELARYRMTREFRIIHPERARIILIQAGPRILPSFPESLSRTAQAALEALGVEIMLHNPLLASILKAPWYPVSGYHLATCSGPRAWRLRRRESGSAPKPTRRDG